MSTVLGLDLGGTKCLGVALDDAGSVVAEHRVATPKGADAVMDALAEVARELVSVTGEQPEGVGVGVPGLVDSDGVLHVSANLPGVLMLRIRDELDRRLTASMKESVRLRVENDASCAAWGEFTSGAARGVHTAIMVTQGTGIGGGIIAGGRLYRGAHGFGGEIGHMVVDPDGPACPCGKHGCWERYASGSALGALARHAVEGQGPEERIVALAGGSVDAVRGEHVSAAAAEGDPTAVLVLREFAWWVALGLANLVELVDPERIVLGGGLVEAGAVVLEPTRKAFNEMIQGSEHRPLVEIVAAELGEHAGAIGAAGLAREPTGEPL